MAIQKFLKHISLEQQFERRQAAWQPNLNVVEEAELWRIDGVLMGEYLPHPRNLTNEHEMKCHDPQAWQAVVHDNESDCP